MTERHSASRDEEVTDSVPFRWRSVPRRVHFQAHAGSDGSDGGLWLLDEPAEDFDAPGYDPGHSDFATRAALNASEARVRDYEYDPYLSRYGGMFLNLASVDGTVESAEGFAHRFGRLGIAERLPVTLLEAPGAAISCGEHLDLWRDCALAMRLGVSAWHLCNPHAKTKDSRAAAAFLKANLRVVFGAGSKYQLVELPELKRLEWPLGGVDRRLELRGHRREAMASLLAQLASAFLAEGTTTELVAGSNAGLELRIRTSSLWQFMWLQLAQAASGHREFDTCDHCGRFYEIGSKKSRKDRDYCTKSCKQMAYRKGKAS